MKKFLVLLLLVNACSSSSSESVPVMVQEALYHAEKVREHFMGFTSEDLSSLIAETRALSRRLKAAKFNKLARKFDSYIDVLMYGNQTLAESVKDMQDLVIYGLDECDYKPCLKNCYNTPIF